MGLDLVELVLEVEEAFDIRLADEDASEIRTVGELFDFVAQSKCDMAVNESICFSAAAFFRLRRAMATELGLNPKIIRPSTKLESIIPPTDRRRFWSKLQAALQWRLPELTRPRWMVFISTFLCIAVSGWGAVAAYSSWSLGGAVFAVLVSLVASGCTASLVTSPFATRIAPKFSTFRGLATIAMARNYAALRREYGSWNPAEAWQSLRWIIVEQLGVNPELVTYDASFVKDLGAS